MNLLELARKDTAGSAFRSWMIALCPRQVAALAIATSLLLNGVEDSLRLVAERQGADIVVVPEGTRPIPECPREYRPDHFHGHPHY